MHGSFTVVCYSDSFNINFINFSSMKKEDISTLKNDINSFKRVRRVVKELILNFPEDADCIQAQEEFVQLSNVIIFLDKTIYRLEKLLSKF